MKHTNKTIFTLISMCVLCGSVLAADGATLFNSASFLAKDKEAASLNASESAFLAKARAAGQAKSHAAIVVNPAAMNSNVITVVLPDGVQYQYIGTKVAIESNKARRSETWTGTSGPRGQMVLNLSQDGIAGSITQNGKHYALGNLPGNRYQVLIELAREGSINEGPIPDAAASAQPQGITK